LDAGSQIASLGFGFNHQSFFGVAHNPAAWNNKSDPTTRARYDAFLKRTLKWNSLKSIVCNSGAEANEIALGHCFENRSNKSAKKVLAFKGSFHGRMLVSLWSSWAPAKRVPFQWPGFETTFVDYPESRDGVIQAPFKKDWLKLWSAESDSDFNEALDKIKGQSDPLLTKEIDSLLQIRNEIKSDQYFAVIIEPMQCEGGDAYTTDRFHNGLINLCKTLKVPLIYDEVQTGFHLGDSFFWHQQFDLKNIYSESLKPDFVTCAKKAQVGLVLMPNICEAADELHSQASLYRGLIHASMLEQNHLKILEIQKYCSAKLNELCKSFSDLITDPRGQGLAFAFRFLNSDHLNPFIGFRFSEGIMCYPAGTDTARFRLNLAFTNSDIDLLFLALSNMLKKIQKVPTDSIPAIDRKIVDRYSVHQKLLSLKNSKQKLSLQDSKKMAADFLKSQLAARGLAHLQIQFIERQNMDQYLIPLEDFETAIYERSRVTTADEFKKALESKHGLGILVLEESKIIAVCIGGSISEFKNIKGTESDPNIDDPNAVYMVDTGVRTEFHGKQIGEILKTAYCMIASQIGVTHISGRNREVYAKSMFSLNASLGATEVTRVPDAYNDDLFFKDSIYYSIPLEWTSELDNKFVAKAMPYIVNKMTLSNFIDDSLLVALEKIADKMPTELRHCYTTSGLSECVDKVEKSIWYFDKKSNKQISFKGQNFGRGSFLARSLSQPVDSFFPVTQLDEPTENNWKAVLSAITQNIENNLYQAVWIEPISSVSGQKVPLDFLKALRILCDQKNVALVFNETNSQNHGYDKGNYFASQLVTPDLAFAYLQGQMGIVFSSKKYFVTEPLSLISTWDGDMFSLLSYVERNLNK
jgi:acetylornithine/succinyldiaminopimelate/putrescine aminotransferase